MVRGQTVGGEVLAGAGAVEDSVETSVVGGAGDLMLPQDPPTSSPPLRQVRLWPSLLQRAQPLCPAYTVVAVVASSSSICRMRSRRFCIAHVL